MDIDEILKKDAFSALDPAQVAALKSALEKVRGKSAMEAAPVIMAHAGALERGRPISREQRAAMVSAMLESMPETERNKFRAIMKMFENK